MARILFLVFLLVFLPFAVVAHANESPGNQHLFYDEFTGTSLGGQWTVQNPDPGSYALSEGVLTTQTLSGELSQNFGDYANLFLIPNTWQTQDFMVTMKVSGFDPTAVSQQIDLVAYTDDYTFVRLANAYVNSGGEDMRTWELWSQNDVNGYGRNLFSADAAADSFYLRLINNGDVYTGSYSLDGTHYYNLQVDNPQTTEFAYLGFLAYQGHDNTGPTTPVQIDSFSVDLIPAWTTTRLQDNGYDVVYNDLGQMAFLADVPLGAEWGTGVFLYSDGQVRLISDIFNNVDSLDINNSGEVVWSGYGFEATSSQVYLYNGTGYSQISQSEYGNGFSQIDDNGVLYWLSYDAVGNGQVFEYDHGVYTQLSDPGSNNYVPFVSPDGHVVWQANGNSDLYLEYGGEFQKINGSYLVYSDPLVNDLGQVVWQGGGSEIYVYDGGAPFLISGDLTYISDVHLNQSGKVVWQSNYDLYVYDLAVGGSYTFVASTNHNTPTPQINGSGQIVYGGYDGSYNQIYLYEGGAVYNISQNTVDNFRPLINDAVQVAWMDSAGQVYAYRDGVTSLVSPAGDLANNLYGVLPDGQVAWNSDYDSLILSSPGGTDAGEYTFTYHYTSGDTYEGRVYTAANEAYATGYRQYAWEESNKYGNYEVTGGTLGSDPGLAGYVELDSYYDIQSGLTFPGAGGLFVYPGYDYLGSESGYIVADTDLIYSFGNDYGTQYEANLPTQYDFVFHYVSGEDFSGDYYIGRVYASPEDGYFNGYQQTTATGYYEIVNATNISSPDSLGQVYVDAYYDSASGHRYTPVNALGVAGYPLLGSESGAIIDAGLSAFQFGPSNEADAANLYTFVFNYSGGDYYYGTVYGDCAGGYYEGYQLDPTAQWGVSLEDGQTGHYEIVSVDYGYNPALRDQIQVAGYHDAQSGTNYTPGAGDLLVIEANFGLGSETGYIISDTTEAHFFGNSGYSTFYEADLGGAVDYFFVHVYGNEQSATLPLTVNTTNDVTPVSNDNGQVVWSGWDGINWEIYLYSDGETRPVTYGEVGDDCLAPWINNNGQIVYSGWDGHSLNIYIYSLNDGTTQELTYDQYNDYFPMIDDNGRVTWLADATSYPDNHTHYTPTDLTRVMVYDVYPTPSISQIAANNYTLNGAINRPVIDQEGEIVWAAYDGAGSDIYLYALADHSTTRMTFSGTAENPYLNINYLDNSQELVWSASDGNDREIYLMVNGGTPTAITNNDYDDRNPVISALGPIVWQEATPNGNEIFGSVYGTTYQITNNTNDDKTPFVNNSGQIVWSGVRNGNYEILQVNAVGDIYYGDVYAPEGRYYPGQVINTVDQHGTPGVYLIVEGYDIGDYDSSGYIPNTDTYIGQVYVYQYYDFESGSSFPNDGDLGVLGNNYLGSEQGAILPGGDPKWVFGGTAGLEADLVGIIYSFTYHYANGSLYSGFMGADPDQGYRPGYRRYTTEETGQQGYYIINAAVDWTLDDSYNAQVSVNFYYDVDTASTYTPIHAGEVVGTQGLGSESDWIIEAGVPQYYFGKGFYMAAISSMLTASSTDHYAYVYTPIADSSFNEDTPSMNGLGQIVYTRFDGHDDEIYLWDNGATIQVTNNDYDDEIPVIWDNRQVTWSGYDGNDWEIFLYNNGPTTQITNNSYDDGHSLYTMGGHEYYYGPHFNGQGKIVWSGGPAGNQDVFLYTISTGQTTQINPANSYDDDFPRLNNSGIIVWYAHEPSDTELYLYNPSDQSITNISNNDFNDNRAKLNNRGQVVWTGGVVGSRQIYFYDQGVVTNISNSASDNEYPAFNYAGQVVWRGFDGAAYQLFAYSDGVVTQITTGNMDPTFHGITDKGEIIWNGFDGEHWQIYYYSGGTTYQVTHSNFDVVNFSWLGDGRIVFSEFNGHDCDIYRAQAYPLQYVGPNKATDGSQNAYAAVASNGGQVVWREYDGSQYLIYYYYGGIPGGEPIVISTTDSLNNDDPVPNAHGQVTWSGFDGTYWQVFFYDDGVTTQLTYNNYDSGHSPYTINGQTRYHQPIINNDGQIVFSGGPADNKDIYLYDLAWGNLEPQRISPADGVPDDYAFINNSGEMVWQHGVSGSRDIYYYDGATVSNLTQSPNDDSRVRIADNGDVVWITQIGGSNWDIYLRRAGSSVNEDISSGNINEDNWPRISNNGLVVWNAYDGHDWEIYLYDGVVNQITDNNYNDAYPRTNNQEQIVWQRYNGHDWDIFLYDHGVTTQISANAYNDFLPKINNLGQITWEGLNSSGISQIYFSHPVTYNRFATQITATANIERNPDINNSGRMVWEGWDGNDWEVFVRDGYDGATTYQLTNNTTDDGDPRINSAGDIVWASWSQDTGSRIYLIPHGTSTPILIANGESPVINDSGLILYETMDEYYNSVLYLWDGEGSPEFITYGDNADLNNSGQIVYQNNDGHDAEIYLYNLFNHTTIQITNNDYRDKDPRINDHGEIVWHEDYGDGWRAFQYRDGEVSQVIYGPYASGAASINNQGRIAMLALDGHDAEIYLQNNTGTFMRRSNDYWDQDNPALAPDSGKMVYGQYQSPTNEDIYQSVASIVPGVRYQFTFSYADGDYYKGTVYSSMDDYDYLYDVGYKQYVTDENGREGYYQITGVEYLATDSRAGQVLVDTYYDAGSGQTLTALNDGTAKGSAYLGSESGYIVSPDDQQYLFGNVDGTFYEADSPLPPVETTRFDFVFHYDSGDYYVGSVYATDAQGYYNGYRQTQDVANGGQGYYEIVNVTPGFGADLANQVFVDSYYDAMSGNRYPVVEAGTPIGFANLGSEAGCIVDDAISAFHFGDSGDGFLAADACNQYTYVFIYGEGDYYYGTMYAAASQGYYEGFKEVVSVEGDQSGYYELVDVVWGFDPSRAGEVLVEAYYDHESAQICNPVNAGTPAGMDYLGSERDYIIDNTTTAHLFGMVQGYQEADVPLDPPVLVAYSFSYSYSETNSGDYYGGVVFAIDGYYALNQVIPGGADQNGDMGSYFISYRSDEDYYFTQYPDAESGQVYVSYYIDSEAGWQYDINSTSHPLLASSPAGTNYLGSESGYIAAAGNPEYIFGKVGDSYHEADVPPGPPTLVGYSFSYYIDADPGDSYYGMVFAPDGYYAQNQVIPGGVDQNGDTGSYLISWKSDSEYYFSQYPDAESGQVYVSGYIDSETGWQYDINSTSHPLLASSPAGTNYLGSESGYIAATGNPEYAFGKVGDSYHEADVPPGPPTLVAYSFAYSYSETFQGDLYYGLVFALDGYYAVYQAIPGGVDQNGNTGTYHIMWKTDEDYYFTQYPDAESGQVYVSYYTDSETGWQYDINSTSHPLLTSSPSGTNYLGSESGYIVDSDAQQYPFGNTFSGGTFYEADNPPPPAETSRFDFVFHYNSGDYYIGSVYDTDTRGYYNGFQQTQEVAGGGQGYYEIVNVTPGVGSGMEGQVFVDSYYDSMCGYRYPVLEAGTPVGADYLGSEAGCIVDAGISAFHFGTSADGFLDVDSCNEYTYVFIYGDGDYYYGTMYAAASQGYYNGYRLMVPNMEGGQAGYYELVNVAYGFDPTLAGEITVAAYGDADSGVKYAIQDSNLFVTLGTNYLKSESGYIVSDGDSAALFGQAGDTFWEGDVPPPPVLTSLYDFVFHYDNGDYYIGSVYAAESQGYYNGYKETQELAGNGQGYYEIVNTTSGMDSGLAGQVFVDSYFDAMSGYRYSVLEAGSPIGFANLGSEAGTIIDTNLPAFHFGTSDQGFLAADACNLYTFIFIYGGGDYYYGTVYGGTDQGYYNGFRQAMGNVEDGQGGYYELVDAAYGFDPALSGQVTVAGYYDAESGNRYQDVDGNLFINTGTGYLGSESGSIIATGDPSFFFGFGYIDSAGWIIEADWHQ